MFQDSHYVAMSTTFIAPPDASFSVEGLDEETPFIYTHWGNPTVAQLELKLPRMGVRVTKVNMADPEDLARNLVPPLAGTTCLVPGICRRRYLPPLGWDRGPVDLCQDLAQALALVE